MSSHDSKGCARTTTPFRRKGVGAQHRGDVFTPFPRKGVAPQARGDVNVARNAIPLNPPSRAKGEAGFTLIELMIAMILGLIVIAGVTSVFLAGQKSFRTNNALADVQDGSRIAFELMARDIRQAGLTGCNSTNGRISNVLNDQTTYWWANWGNVVHGYDDASADPALTGITGNGAPVAGDNSLQLISAGTDVDATSAIYDGTAQTFTLHTPAPALAAGDVVMVCTPGHAAIFQTKGYTQSSGTVTFDGATGNPGNASTYLAYPSNADCTAQGDAAIYCFPANSLLSKLTAVDWYLGTNGEGGTSLYRVSLQNKTGTPTPVTSEMVRNVTSMTITYLDPILGNTFVKASLVPASDWAAVTAVRVELTLASTFQRASANGQAPISRTYAFTTSLRNRAN